MEVTRSELVVALVLLLARVLAPCNAAGLLRLRPVIETDDDISREVHAALDAGALGARRGRGEEEECEGEGEGDCEGETEGEQGPGEQCTWTAARAQGNLPKCR